MKYRKGFVTNSSSSSFICDVCGEVFDGYDVSLSDFDLVECENGHTICESELIKNVNYKDFILKRIIEDDYVKTKFENYLNNLIVDETIEENQELDEDYYKDFVDRYMDFRYSVPEEYCPVCQYKIINLENVKSYLIKKYKLNINELKKEINEINENNGLNIYRQEYIDYICKKYNTTIDCTIKEIKEKFPSFSNFMEYIK